MKPEPLLQPSLPQTSSVPFDKDWYATPLGPVSKWPQALKTAVRIALTSRHSMGVWWGEELIYLYNDSTQGDARRQASTGARLARGACVARSLG
jgi:hypothetical protein